MRIVSALGLTLVHLLLQAQLPVPVPKGSVPEAPVGQAQPGLGGSSLDKYKVNYKRFTRGTPKPVQDEAGGRREWFRKRMGGDLKPEFARRLLDEAARERATYPSQFPSPGAMELPLAAAGTTWVPLGPNRASFAQNGTLTLLKVDSGRLKGILPDTADATGNTVYVLASGGGLWKSTNFQSPEPTWTPLTDLVGSSMSGAMAFGTRTSTLYVGAGDYFDDGIGGFVIKSTDGGRSWNPAAKCADELKNAAASKVMDIKVDTSQDPEVVLVGTDEGLWRSADGGASFSLVTSKSMRVWSIVSSSQGSWLASVVDTSEDKNKEGKGSVLVSTDRGAQWKPTAFPQGSGRITLAVGKPGDDIVYAYTAVEPVRDPISGKLANSKAQKDLYRSPDGGTTWIPLGITAKQATNLTKDPEQLKEELLEQSNMDLMHDQAWFNQMILVDPSDSLRKTVYLGGSLYSAKTVDGGATWALTSQWLAEYGLPYVHADFHCAAYSNFNGKPRIYFGTDGGLFISDTDGADWDDSKNVGLLNHLVYSLAANPGVAGSALVGLQDNGTRIRSGTTSTFNQVLGGDGMGVGWAQDVSSSQAVSLASGYYNGIARSTTSPVTGGGQLKPFTAGLGLTGMGPDGKADNGLNYYFVTPIITPPPGSDKSGQVFFTYGNDGNGPNSGKIFQSSAAGWSAIGTPGQAGISATRRVAAVSHGIGVSPVDTQHIAAAGTDGWLLITENGGTNWTELKLGSVDSSVNPPKPVLGAISGWYGNTANIAWANNNLLYVCSEAPYTDATRVAKSTNRGVDWTKADAGLPQIPVTKLVVDLGDSTGNTVYAATWLGIYRTTNGGSSWSLFGTGLPQCRVTDIWVAPDSSTVRVATWGRGVWELQLSTSLPTIASFTPASGVAGAEVTITGKAFTGATEVKFNGTSALLFSVVSDTSIGVTVPAFATSGTLTVTTPGGTGISPSPFPVTTPAPTIASFTPASGVVGTAVTLTGTDLTGTSAVSFNGTTALFTVSSDTSISTVVPAGATTGTLAVTTPGGTATSATSFSVTSPAPAITSLNPTSGLVGTAVILTGTAFTGATAVKFNGTAATFTVNSDTAIRTTVPAGATSGNVTVTTPAGTGTSASPFTMSTPAPAPAITSLSPTSGLVGTAVTLTGTAFTGATAVKFNGTTTLFSVTSDTSISTVVPAGATSGTLSVTTPAGTGTSTSSFTVTVPGPAITSFNPASGILRSAVTLTGTGFTGTTSVKFNGTATTFTVLSDTAISTSVPTGATSGTLTVTTPLGTATSASSFSIKTRDFNGDGIIDVLDLATLVKAFGSVPSSSHWNPAADLTGDGVVDELDLALFLAGM